MEQQNSFDPDRTVTINAGRGPGPGLVLGLLGFLASLVAIIGIGLVSLDIVADDLGGTGSTQQELDVDGH